MFREISTGAADDLARATDIARAMVLRYGMSEALGNVTYDRDRSPFLQPNMPAPQERNYSEETAEAVDRAVRQLVDRAFQKAYAILQQNRALLDRTAAALLETETLGRARDRAPQTRDRRAAGITPGGYTADGGSGSLRFA